MPDETTPTSLRMRLTEQGLLELTKRFFPWMLPKYVGMLFAEYTKQPICSFCYSIQLTDGQRCPYCS